ncbi:ABC transporter permease [Fulvivirgaceae bacterium LMO-SS25]
MENNKVNWSWLWKMAWRDTRKNRSRLLLFISSIVLGIAAIVAINSFGDNLTREINNQAKELLGADLSIEARDDTSSIYISMPIIDSAKVAVFASMASFSSNDGARLTQIRAMKGAYPFYGPLAVQPLEAREEFFTGQKALVDRTLMMQYDAKIGDSVNVGALSFEIVGILDGIPGQSGIVASVAPAVIIPWDYLEGTQLIQRGSRVEYTSYYQLADGTDPDKWVEENEEALRDKVLRADTVEERKEDTNRAFGNLNKFLGLVAFVALLLGCVGVASSVFIYIREKIATVAILRCLGVSGLQAFLIYVIQIGLMGLIGSIIGALIGVGVQQLLPLVLQDFLPITVDTSLSFPSIFFGIITGLIVSILFALPPLIQIRNASPLLTIRAESSSKAVEKDWLNWLVYGLIVGFIYLFAFNQIGEWQEAGYFTLALLVAIGIIALISKLVMWLVRKFFPVSWGFVWRQSLANLYRPHNQTLVLLATIGLGTALVSTVFYVQDLLVAEVELSSEDERPNLLMFDIQSSQLESIKQLMEESELEVLQSDPVVNMRLLKIKDVTRQMARDDSTIRMRDGIFTREYRVSYRAELSETESIVKGEWIGSANPGGAIPISIEEGFAGSMKVDVGDSLIFDVQGVPMLCQVASFRKVDWNRVSSNFLVTFPAGVLENAPQFHIITTRVPSPMVSAKFQQAVVRNFPTVSIVDLGQILATVEEVLSKIAFVIRFMALFSILTGLVVLMGSVTLSKFQRLKESVLLRTLGSSQKQILTITLFEYFILGSLASLTGILLAFASTAILAKYSFDAVFQPASLPVVITYLLITSLTMFIGYWNSRGVIGRPPLEILRAEI